MSAPKQRRQPMSRGWRAYFAIVIAIAAVALAADIAMAATWPTP